MHPLPQDSPLYSNTPHARLLSEFLEQGCFRETYAEMLIEQLVMYKKLLNGSAKGRRGEKQHPFNPDELDYHRNQIAQAAMRLALDYAVGDEGKRLMASFKNLVAWRSGDPRPSEGGPKEFVATVDFAEAELQVLEHNVLGVSYHSRV